MKFIIFILFISKFLFGESPNFLIISIDTLNVKRTSLFNYKEETTPFLKKLSERGVLLKNSYTPVPLTLPAHATILTGLFPHNLGVYDNLNSSLSNKFLTLPEILKSKGYETVGIVSSYILSSSFGISKGFDYFEEISFEKLKGGSLEVPERNAKETTEIALKYLKKERKKPIFIFLHYYDPHTPYNPPEPFKYKFKDFYDGEVAFVDSQIEFLFEAYPEIKNFWVFIVSDHGEGLGENGELTHGYFLYKSTMNVLFLVIPPISKRDIKIYKESLTSLGDLFPTILNLAKIKEIPKCDGKSLFENFEKRILPLETLYPFIHHNFSPLRGTFDGKFWYIYGSEEYLFDMDRDENQSFNLLERFKDNLRNFKKNLKELFQNPLPPQSLSPENLASSQIKSLGYLAGPLKEIPPMEKWKNLVSPFKKKKFINKLTLALEKEEEINTLRSLEKEAPEDPEVFKLLGDYFKRKRDFKNSIKYYEKTLKNSPFYYEVYLNLGQCYLKEGNFQKALIYLKNYLNFIPEDPIGIYYYGFALDEAGKTEDAIKNFKRSMEKNFITQEVLIKLSLALIKIKREGEAEEILKKYLKDFYKAPILYLLGNLYLKKDKKVSINYYKEAIKIMPEFMPPYLELSKILDTKKGIEILMEAIKLDPTFPEAWILLGDLYLKEKNKERAKEFYNNGLKYLKNGEKEKLKERLRKIDEKN